MPPSIHYRLDALNFFLADVRGGLGSFVSVFLVTAAGWTPAEIGMVLTASGLIGICLHVPVGAMIDARGKRALLVGAVALLAGCAIAIERSPTVPVVFTADVIMAVLGGVFAPTIAALTLGLVPEHVFPERLARNAVWDRIGNLTIAAIVGVVGWWWSQRTTFYLLPFFAVVSAVVILTIPANAIDHDRARGFAREQSGHAHAQGFWSLLTGNKPFIILACVAATFHFANASMLPLVGQKLGLAHPGLETALMSACILVAQFVTIPVAMIAGAKVDEWGLKFLFGAACVALAVRGLAFAWFDSAPMLIAAQALEGVSTGIWDVLVPVILADIVVGSGRYSASRGVLGTVQGAGGSISNAAAGTMVMLGGYAVAFAGLAFFALLACGLVALLPEPEHVKEERLRRLREQAA
jgi:MFS family permease